jgi:hypothetical protein
VAIRDEVTKLLTVVVENHSLTGSPSCDQPARTRRRAQRAGWLTDARRRLWLAILPPRRATTPEVEGGTGLKAVSLANRPPPQSRLCLPSEVVAV